MSKLDRIETVGIMLRDLKDAANCCGWEIESIKLTVDKSNVEIRTSDGNKSYHPISDCSNKKEIFYEVARSIYMYA